MARFDVHLSVQDGTHLLDCQADVLAHFRSRFVVPLLPTGGTQQATRLHPVFKIGGNSFVMVTQLAAAVPLSELGKPVASLAEEQPAIMNALDMLITGY